MYIHMYMHALPPLCVCWGERDRDRETQRERLWMLALGGPLYLILFFSTLIFEARSFIEPGGYQFDCTAWPASSRDPHVPPSPGLEQQAPTTLSGLLYGCLGLFRIHVCVTSMSCSKHIPSLYFILP